MLKSTLTQWKTFTTVIDEGGYLQASDKLNRSHSALHHAVHKLETQLGAELIFTHDRRLHLTPLGEVMYRRAKQLVADAEELEALVGFAREGWETELTLAVDSLFPKHLLNYVLQAFHDENLGIRLKIKSVILNAGIEAIVKGTADIVIAPYPPKGYLGTPLVNVRLVPLAAYTHPLLNSGEPVEARELSRHLQIVISDETDGQTRVDTGWLKSEQRWSVSDFHHARDILLSGIGFCWLPEYMFREEINKGLLEIIPTQEMLERVIALHLVIPRPDRIGPAAKLLAQLFRDNRSLTDST